MKTKRTGWWIAIALVSGVMIFLYLFLQPVPSYVGKDANFWFDKMGQYPVLTTPNSSSVDSLAAFRGMGPSAATFLMRKLEQANSWERWYSTRWALSPQSIQKVLPAPVDWVSRREKSIYLLEQLGPSAKGAIPELIPFYFKLRERSKNNALRGPGMVVAGVRVFGLYEDESVCTRILKILGTAGAEDPGVLDVLIQALGDQDMSGTASRALVDLAKKDRRVISRLNAELSSTNSVARYGSASAVRNIGPAAKDVVARLKERVSVESDKRIRFMVADALWKIDRQAYAVIPFRIEELKMQDDSMRWNAATCLGGYGNQSTAAIPALMELLKDPSNRVRGIAAIALGKIGPSAKEAVPALTGATKDEYSNVREAAAEALKKIQQTELQ